MKLEKKKKQTNKNVRCMVFKFRNFLMIDTHNK